METSNDKLIFQLENEKTGKVIYKYEIELAKFQKETIENENVSFYYSFKDMKNELEELVISKIKPPQNKEDILFVVRYSDKILYKSILDITGIDEWEMAKNEVELYFIFEKTSKIIINQISEEHKNIILSNI
jgi:hypothetical protein